MHLPTLATAQIPNLASLNDVMTAVVDMYSSEVSHMCRYPAKACRHCQCQVGISRLLDAFELTQKLDKKSLHVPVG